MATTITFDRSLYLPEAVEAAVAAYADHAKIDLRSTDDTVVATIDATSDIDATLIVDAFCNHALYETISRLRRSTLSEA